MTEAISDRTGPSLYTCAYCAAQSSDLHICSECGRLQPVAPGTDYFAFFGLPRKLRLDEAALEKSFYSLSRRFHPDYFMNAPAAERQASLDRSSLLNDAYRALRDPVSRAQYLLSLEGYKEAEKKAPPDLLEEVFELNMQIEELKAAKKTGDEEAATARASLEEALDMLRQRLQDIDRRLVALFEAWDQTIERPSDTAEKRATLDRMSELLSHRSYIHNLARDIKEEI
ncbi:MAG TPA: Fe-S protein assembly co-chaperone HscB [Blastocatellia bacterium]|nr:Fe-S protein assembly co-chaperone HscB [Blastocatellia bacterium]